MLSSRKTLGAFFLIFALSFVGTALAQEKLTVEWIYSDAYAEIAAMPQVQWLENGNLLLLDNRVPKAERTLEMLQAGKWKRAPWVKREMALNSLQALLPADADSVKSLGWPAAISPNGENLAYLFEKDIYLLNAKTSLFSRLTKSEGEEKSLNFSPDGKKLAYVRDNDLYVYHLINSSEARLTKTGGETLLNGTLSWVYWEEIFGRRDIGYWWSGNSRQIAFLRSDESAVSKMFFVNQRPDIPELITQRYPKAGTENPTVHVGVVNASGEGEATWLELGDYEYIARVKWLPGDQKVGVQVLNRPQTELTLFLADPRTGKSEKIMTESDTAWVNINDDLYFLDNGKDFLWQSERSGFAHLYRFNMNGQLRNQITNGEWALRSSGGAYWLRQSVMAIDQKKEQVYFTGMKESSVQRHLYRVDFNGGNLTKISKEKGVHSIQFSPDARYYVDSYS
ncbi:MAG: DPP IV N-terminal domain-containing protein, partial [Calditrichaeota bacterium]|nr:DPP IV N-terminal domain-containing protein [Calditrichota bacterium]